jgi:MoxR-like ATPase
MVESYCILFRTTITPFVKGLLVNLEHAHSSSTHIFDNNLIDEIKEESLRFQQLRREIAKTIIGNEDTITFLMTAILSNGHVLLEGVPGVAKTTMIKTLTSALGLSFKRIQFTPDLLPADLIGTLIYNQKIQDFEVKKGPLFSHIILADEINRASAKVQSALLEAMQEHQVTIGSTTHQLDKPFLVFATQNPLEQEGTYRLPEAQVDRFMFKLIVSYPNKNQEKAIILREHAVSQQIHQVLTKDDINKAQLLVNKVYMDEAIVNYLVDLIFATRHPEKYGLSEIKKYIEYGISPRGTLALATAGRAYAFLQRRHFVTPEDIKMIAGEVVRHRLVLTYQAEAEQIKADDIIKKIIATVPTP